MKNKWVNEMTLRVVFGGLGNLTLWKELLSATKATLSASASVRSTVLLLRLRCITTMTTSRRYKLLLIIDE